MYFYLALAIFFMHGEVKAETICDSKSIHTFYTRLKEANPIKDFLGKKSLEAGTFVDIAKQRPNPQVELEYLKGSDFGIGINSYRVTAQHVFEYGSKRQSRIDEANISVSLQNRSLYLKELETNVNYIIKYQRVAQLEIVAEAVEEAILTFQKVIGKLESRSGLNPEERVSLLTLKLASNDYKAKLNDLENEKTILLGEIQFISNCSTIKPVLGKLNYGEILDLLGNSSSTDKGLINIENLKKNHAAAEFEIQKSLGYSNISVGPTIEYQNVGADEFLSAGFSVSFALPIFHTNTGGKLNASKKLVSQTINTKNSIRELEIKKERLYLKYKRSVTTLSKMTSLEALNKQHLEVEKLFSRGIVSIQITIESHRQHIDFLQSRFDTENDLLASLGEFVFITGASETFETLFQNPARTN